MKAQPTETFVGFGSLIFGAALLATPVLGAQGFIGAIVTMYFCLVFLNGASGGKRRG
jgi:hypothetical protein